MSGPFRVPDASTTVASSNTQDVASGDPLNNIAADRITTAREAAAFLRQAALGSGTYQEIQEVLAAGSRTKWLTRQIFTPETLRSNPVWNIGDPNKLPAPGYFSNVCRTLFPPRNNGDSPTIVTPTFNFPGTSFTIRCLLTAFLNNRNIDPLATTFSSAVGSSSSLNGGLGGYQSALDEFETFRLKATWVLSKFIPVSVQGGAWDAPDKATSIAMWYTLLHRGAFGTYADLLEEVTYSPPMSTMLTYIGNEKEKDGRQPDENYAREIMQLFTLGLYEINIDGTYKLDANGDRIPTYDNDDVYQMARVFTGLGSSVMWDADTSKSIVNGPSYWMLGIENATWYYEEEPVPDWARDTLFTTAVSNGGPYAINSYDGNISYQSLDIYALSSTTTTIAIPATGDQNTITVASTAQFPSRGAIKIDDEIFHYDGKGATTFNIRAITYVNAPASRRGHMMSTIQAHPIGSTVRPYRPYWYEPGVPARLAHCLWAYEKGPKYALKGLVDIPANTHPAKNIRMAIEALVAHPSCAPFVCKNLIKHLVTSNPSPGYVARVARVFENDGQGVRGNLGAVWMAILTDPEACNTTQTSQKAGRVLDGFELFASLVRPFHRIVRPVPQGSTSEHSAFINGVYQTANYGGYLNTWGGVNAGLGNMWPYSSPSIFGHYPPDYSVAPGSGWGLITPELGAYSSFITMQITHEILGRVVIDEPKDFVGMLDYNKHYQMCPSSYSYAMTGATGGESASGAALVEHMNLLLCGGNVAQEKLDGLSEVVSTDVSSDTARQNRITSVATLLMYTPEFYTQ